MKQLHKSAIRYLVFINDIHNGITLQEKLLIEINISETP